LTAAGSLSLEALSVLEAFKGVERLPAGPRAHALLEVLRLAWKDRLEFFGDPAQVNVPVEKLISREHASELAEKARVAVEQGKAIDTQVAKHTDEGTNNLCVADRQGNIVTVTLTHGGGFGAQVTVDGLGLTLGHGMSRFDPHPGLPNSVGPGKRPVHNMCPTVVLRDGAPIIGVGCAGGVRIPNCVYDALRKYLFEGKSMENAIEELRVQCTGTFDVAVEPGYPAELIAYLKRVGFRVGTWDSSAVASGVSYDRKNGECRAAIRSPAILGMGLR
jgi:gamma-glutamyltranspeptidase/glutathione hydrolase